MKPLFTAALTTAFFLVGTSVYADDAKPAMSQDHSAEKAEWKACMDKTAAANPGMSHRKMKKACHAEMHMSMHHEDKAAGATK